MQDEIDGLQRELRAWRARYAGLSRDKDAEARKDPLYESAERLFNEWKRLCRKPRSDWTPDRFRMVHPFLKRKGFDICLLAIQGAGFDAFSKVQANGRTKYFNDWKLIWRDEDTFENFCNRASPEDLATYKAKREAEDDAAT